LKYTVISDSLLLSYATAK